MITREHEYLQPAGPGLWNDSHNFIFTDAKSETEVCLRFGCLPNENGAHTWVIVAPPKGATYQRIDWDLLMPEGNIEDLCLGIARVQMLEPLKTFRLLAEDDQLRIDVRWHGLMPPCELGGGDASGPKNYSQSGSAEGELEVAGRRRKVKGYGYRSRSWGPRDFSSFAKYRCIQGQIGEKFSFMVMKVILLDGRKMTSGYIFDGENTRRASGMSGEMAGLVYGEPRRSAQLKIQDSDGKEYALRLHSVGNYSVPFSQLLCCHDICRIDSEMGTGYGWIEDAVGRGVDI